MYSENRHGGTYIYLEKIRGWIIFAKIWNDKRYGIDGVFLHNDARLERENTIEGSVPKQYGPRELAIIEVVDQEISVPDDVLTAYEKHANLWKSLWT